MKNSKFKTSIPQRVVVPQTGKALWVRRIKAVHDIPLHNVKAGDFGGFIGPDVILSEKGSSWIADNAIVTGKIRILSDTLIKDNAFVSGVNANMHADLIIGGDVCISGNAIIDSYLDDDIDYPEYNRFIGGSSMQKITIKDDVVIKSPKKITGSIAISESVRIEPKVSISGTVDIYGSVLIEEDVVLSGTTKINGRIHPRIPRGTTIHDGMMGGKAEIPSGASSSASTQESDILKYEKKIQGYKDTIQQRKLELEKRKANILASYPSSRSSSKEDDSDEVYWTEKFASITARMNDYTNDIVKLLKYPVMNDLTDPFTSELIVAFNRAESVFARQKTALYEDCVTTLEHKFMVAESNAHKIATSHLDDNQKRRLTQAQDLFNVALDSASTDNEKRLSFKKGFSQLEGVVAVPENAIHSLRTRVGLPELEI